MSALALPQEGCASFLGAHAATREPGRRMDASARPPDQRAPSRRAMLLAAICAALMLGGCAMPHPDPIAVSEPASLTPPTPASRDLLSLPPPKGKVVVAVYGFRDQTGQYKPAPDSSFSTSVTQGAASMLVKALKDSGWFLPVERESLQELLTERRIVRALEGDGDDTAKGKANIPALLPASVLVDGGVIAYESNVRTGGAGARFLGIGLSTQYRVDQVTVNLRSVDIRNGQVLHSVSTTKTIYSYEIRPSVFRFVNFKELLEVEAGVTNNEPAQLCVKEAIEAAVVHLAVQGIKDRSWALNDEADWNAPIIQSYLHQAEQYAVGLAADPGAMATAPAPATN